MTLVSDNLPKSATPMPRVVYFLFVSIVYSAVVIAATILNMRLRDADTENKSLRYIQVLADVLRLRFITNCFCCNKTKKMDENCDNKRGIVIQLQDECKRISDIFDRIALVYSTVFIVIYLIQHFLCVL